MKEFKLIPISEVELCVGEKHTRPIPHKIEADVVKVGNDDFNVIMKNLMSDEKTNEDFKLKLMNYISQKMDNKINDSSEISKEENKSTINSNIFDVVKSSIFAADIPNAYRLFTYFVEKKNIQWNEHGVIEISGNKIDLDIYKLLKYLTTRNMKINNDDRDNLKRLLYTAHSIKKFIKNSHIIRLMEEDKDIDDAGDEISNIIIPSQPRVMRKRKSKVSRINLTGNGLWTHW